MKALIIAKKEFSDIVTSKRFLALLAAMLLTYLLFVSQVGQFSTISIRSVFGFLGSQTIAFVGGILGLAIGFDMISREKESGTLRTLLSHPVFRDEIVVGKAIAALAAICVIVLVTVTFIIGVSAFYGYIPTLGDAGLIAKFILATIAYLFTMFSIGLFFSALFKSSTTSLTVSLTLFVMLAIFVPIMAYFLASTLAGPAPQPPVDFEKVDENVIESPEWKKYEEESKWYFRRVQEVTQTILLISPQNSYTTLVSSFATSSEFMPFQPTDTTKNALSFVILPLVLFTLTYVRFTREEL